MADERPFDRLMADLRAGDTDAAREVFDRYARRLVGLAAARLPSVVRSKLDPDDVVISVFRTFLRRHSKGEFHLDHWDSLWSLLAVLAVRKCGHRVGHLLAARRDARREVRRAGPADTSAPAWDPPDPAPTPQEALLLEETLGQVLAGLKDRERTVVLLRLQGYTIPEVAAEAGCSERTAHRILEGVRVRLEARAAE